MLDEHVKLDGAVPPDRVVARSSRGLMVFFGVLVPLSAIIETALIITNDELLIIALMMTPVCASLIARAALREGIRDISLRFGGRRTWAAIAFALVFPVAIGAATYVPTWGLGLAAFAPPAPIELVKPLMFGGTIGLVLAAGEEVGWRGYMLTRLIDSGAPKPLLTSGIIWGAWHVPLVAAGAVMFGRPIAVTVGLFLVTIVSFAYLIGRLRLETGSIWPAIVMHAAWNSVIQDVFDRSTTGENATLWTGESGVLVAAAVTVVALIFSIVIRPAHRLSWPPTRPNTVRRG